MVALYTHYEWVNLTPGEFASYSLIRAARGDDISIVLLALTVPGAVDISAALGPVGALVVGSTGDDTIISGAGNDALIGQNGHDVLYGGDGNDSLETMRWTMPTIFGDTLYGGADNDSFWTNNEDFHAGTKIYGGSGEDILHITNSTLRTHQLHNFILTEEMSIEAVSGTIAVNPYKINIIDLGTATFSGFVRLGGAGTYFRADHGYYGVMAGGNDTIFASDMPNDIYGGGETHAGAGDDTLHASIMGFGDDGNDWIDLCQTGYGGAGNDYITFETAAYGGDGSDGLRGSWTGEVFGGKGHDRFILDGTLSLDGSAVHYTTGDQISNFESVHIARAILSDLDDVMDIVAQKPVRYLDVVIEGRGGNDDLRSGAGKQTLDGGLGADTMAGGEGNDLYYLDDAGDVIIELAGGGRDRAIILQDYQIGPGLTKVEHFEVAAGVTGLTLRGNVDGNHIYSLQSEGSQIYGLGGRDTLMGGVSNRVYGGQGDDSITLVSGQGFGGEGNDSLSGGYGNSTLAGGAGADTLRGGLGDDILYIDALDVVQGDEFDGLDEIRTAVTVFDMHLNAWSVENFVSLSNAGVDVLGNHFGNHIVGGSGNDSLDGYFGRDRLEGGRGDDSYWVEAELDQILEAADEGLDTVFSSAKAFVMNANVENCVLMTFSQTVQGNDLGNSLSGGSGSTFLGMGGDDTITGGIQSDTLDGGTGNDSMTGGLNNDTYIVDSVGDKIIEFVTADGVYSGVDRILTTLFTYVLIANVEELFALLDVGQSLSGNTLANWIGGGVGNDTLSGADGDDVLQGWAGMDRLTGGTGHDVFLFDTAPSIANQDTITDFQHLGDRIVLDRDSNSGLFAALATGALASTAFTTSTTLDAFDRIIYRPSTGEVYYDADGSGATEAVLFATLSTRPSLTYADFFVI